MKGQTTAQASYRSLTAAVTPHKNGSTGPSGEETVTKPMLGPPSRVTVSTPEAAASDEQPPDSHTPGKSWQQCRSARPLNKHTNKLKYNRPGGEG